MLLRHICEVCDKEEILTVEQAYDQGWDYPPKMGEFKVASPRTCGYCSINGSLWWLLCVEGKKIADLDEKQLQTLSRILQEPENIMVG
ncbi:hypothetical protein BK147_26355 [Paenibacillus sp. FSL R7-0337]|nr:hypothetical protein BK147_26355 [Paenibacillus sp. FSL R7-0337]